MSELSGLIASAHLIRAKEKAKRFAAQTGQPWFIFSTPRGLEIDPAPPQIAQQWHVATPTGEVFKVKRKGT